jgi:biotin transport system substrate-specific component
LSRSDDKATTPRGLAIAALFAALTAVGAFVSVPLIGPVPFSLQVLFVLLAGLVLGPRLGALAMLAYIAVGLVAPVYAGGTGGLGVLLGPAGGYLWGFVPAAAVAGWLAQRSARPGYPLLVGAAVAGLLCVYAVGAPWLAWQLHAADVRTVLVGGVLQFLPLDALKCVLAAALARALAAAPIRLPSGRRAS